MTETRVLAPEELQDRDPSASSGEPRTRGCSDDFAQLKPTNALGLLYASSAIALTTFAIVLSLNERWWIWAAGQLLFALSLLQWFAMIHEAGHRTLFRSHWANQSVGYLAGVFAIIPFPCWKIVHARHHRWTGWQDMDTTTASLVPRELRFWERWAVNACWATGFPLFSIIYRLSNYWNYPRLHKWFSKESQQRSLRNGVLSHLALYAVATTLLCLWLGPVKLLTIVGLPLFVTLMMQDPLILSQHTHIPMQLAGGAKVKPFSPLQQQMFTRSLRFPTWFSRWILINVDAHELHHMYPRVPGYFLHCVDEPTENSIAWWRWLWLSKSVRGDVLLFQNRELTGYRF